MVGAVLPFVSGGGLLVRAATHADDVIDALKVVNAADDVLDAANAVDNALDTGNALDNLTEIAKVAEDIPCSFSAETDVLTWGGTKDIAAIEVGDYVLAWNEADGTLGYYRVTAVMTHQDQVLTELIVDGEWLETTPEHPFYVEGQGWTPAADLRFGDQIHQADGTTGRVWLKWNVHKPQEMYNLTVDTAHTFFVGKGQCLVHNACPPYNRRAFGDFDPDVRKFVFERDNYTRVYCGSYGFLKVARQVWAFMVRQSDFGRKPAKTDCFTKFASEISDFEKAMKCARRALDNFSTGG